MAKKLMTPSNFGGHKKTVRDEIYERLREDILHGVYKPGDWLREEELSHSLGTSRMPVREALRVLGNEGFLEHFPNRGSRVTEVLTDDLAALYDIRITVECIIARRAAARITNEQLERMARNLDDYVNAPEDALVHLAHEFSTLVVEASGSPSLQRIGQAIYTQIARLRYRTHGKPERKPITFREHQAIYNALRKGDPDLAEAATLAHFASAKARSLEDLRNRKETEGTG